MIGVHKKTKTKTKKHIFVDRSVVKVKVLSRVQLFVTPWPIQSMEFSRPEY